MQLATLEQIPDRVSQLQAKSMQLRIPLWYESQRFLAGIKENGQSVLEQALPTANGPFTHQTIGPISEATPSTLTAQTIKKET